jgi:hypothetical protein
VRGSSTSQRVRHGRRLGGVAPAVYLEYMAVRVVPVKLAPDLGRTHWKRLLAALIVQIRGCLSVVVVGHRIPRPRKTDRLTFLYQVPPIPLTVRNIIDVTLQLVRTASQHRAAAALLRCGLPDLDAGA